MPGDDNLIDLRAYFEFMLEAHGFELDDSGQYTRRRDLPSSIDGRLADAQSDS